MVGGERGGGEGGGLAIASGVDVVHEDEHLLTLCHGHRKAFQVQAPFVHKNAKQISSGQKVIGVL